MFGRGNAQDLKPIPLFIYFWLLWVFVPALGLYLVAGGGGYSLVEAHGLLTETVCFVLEHEL